MMYTLIINFKNNTEIMNEKYTNLLTLDAYNN